MRWERLFADLDGQFEAAERGELAGEVADRSRREVAQVTLVSRLRMAVGLSLRVGVGAAGVVDGPLMRVGPDWLLLGRPDRRAADGSEALVPLSAVGWVGGLPVLTEPAAAEGVEARLGLAYALRGIARDRTPVRVALRDGTSVAGTLDRVGADFVDLAEHDPDEPRRAGAVRAVRTIAFGGLAVIRPG